MKLNVKALALEAGFHIWPKHPDRIYPDDEEDDCPDLAAKLSRFAELVQAVTREDCALTLEAMLGERMPINARWLSEAIRALSKAPA